MFVSIPGTRVLFPAPSGHFFEFMVHTDDNLLIVRVLKNDGVTEAGDPIRFKETNDGKIAADFPGVSNADFAVDSSGHITNG